MPPASGIWERLQPQSLVPTPQLHTRPPTRHYSQHTAFLLPMFDPLVSSREGIRGGSPPSPWRAEGEGVLRLPPPSYLALFNACVPFHGPLPVSLTLTPTATTRVASRGFRAVCEATNAAHGGRGCVLCQRFPGRLAPGCREWGQIPGPGGLTRRGPPALQCNPSAGFGLQLGRRQPACAGRLLERERRCCVVRDARCLVRWRVLWPGQLVLGLVLKRLGNGDNLVGSVCPKAQPHRRAVWKVPQHRPHWLLGHRVHEHDVGVVQRRLAGGSAGGRVPRRAGASAATILGTGLPLT
eukprot:363791-Chlamydomonas_euryale.AAC.7